jgi:hypothetical protein
MLLRALADKRKVNCLTPHQTDRILDLPDFKKSTIKGTTCRELGLVHVARAHLTHSRT